jgi:hypothetical protein
LLANFSELQQLVHISCLQWSSLYLESACPLNEL